MTAEEFDEWGNRPENADRRCELDRGEVVDHPAMGERAGCLIPPLCSLVWGYLAALGRGYACVGTGLIVRRTPDTVRGVGLMAFTKSRRFDELRHWPEEPPALIAEVIGAWDTAEAMARRVAEYLSFGVPVVWVVDPVGLVTAHRPGREPVILRGADELPFPEPTNFVGRVADVFRMPEDGAA